MSTSEDSRNEEKYQQIACLDIGKSNMSSFRSLTEEQKQVSRVMEVCLVLAIKLSARGDIPLSSSRTTCSISGTSCCELKSKAVPQLKEMLLSKRNVLSRTGLVIWT